MEKIEILKRIKIYKKLLLKFEKNILEIGNLSIPKKLQKRIDLVLINDLSRLYNVEKKLREKKNKEWLD